MGSFCSFHFIFELLLVSEFWWVKRLPNFSGGCREEAPIRFWVPERTRFLLGNFQCWRTPPGGWHAGKTFNNFPSSRIICLETILATTPVESFQLKLATSCDESEFVKFFGHAKVKMCNWKFESTFDFLSRSSWRHSPDRRRCCRLTISGSLMAPYYPVLSKTTNSLHGIHSVNHLNCATWPPSKSKPLDQIHYLWVL